MICKTLIPDKSKTINLTCNNQNTMIPDKQKQYSKSNKMHLYSQNNKMKRIVLEEDDYCYLEQFDQDDCCQTKDAIEKTVKETSQQPKTQKT